MRKANEVEIAELGSNLPRGGVKYIQIFMGWNCLFGGKMRGKLFFLFFVGSDGRSRMNGLETFKSGVGLKER